MSDKKSKNFDCKSIDNECLLEGKTLYLDFMVDGYVNAIDAETNEIVMKIYN